MEEAQGRGVNLCRRGHDKSIVGLRGGRQCWECYRILNMHRWNRRGVVDRYLRRVKHRIPVKEQRIAKLQEEIERFYNVEKD